MPLRLHGIEAHVGGWTTRIQRRFDERVAEFQHTARSVQRSTVIQNDADMSRNIKQDATKDVPTGYFTLAMKPMYDTANLDSGEYTASHTFQTAL